jgi:glutamate racemase
LLTGVLHYVMGHDVALISSAEETAKDVFAELAARDGFRSGPEPRHRFVSSGDPATFQALGARFLGPEIGAVEERSLGPSDDVRRAV